MKKITFMIMLLLGVVMSVALASCGGSDDDNNAGNFDINQAYGTWMCTTSTDTYNGHTSTGLLVGKEVAIKSDGTYTSTGSTMGSTGTWTANGNQITAKSSAGTFVVTVQVSGNNMIWDGTSSSGVTFHYIFQKES